MGVRELTADVAIVGSGPGGATLARELARAGRDVVLLERGRDWRSHALYGTYPGALLYADRSALLFTKGGLNIIRPLMLGGATSMYCGCAAPPPDWLSEKYGVDVESEARSAAAELGIAPLPDELRGEVSTRVAEAGRALGMDWQPQEKFMFSARADFDCGARCMLGCRCGAKWNAAEYVDDAVAAGCRVHTRTRVRRVLSDGRTVSGVQARGPAGELTVHANRVVIAGGGIGSVELLRGAGIDSAGHGIAMDTTAMVYGVTDAGGMGGDPPMTWSCEDDDVGVLYSTLIDPWLMYPIIMATKGPRWPLTWPRWKRTAGVMIKLRDEVSGGIDDDGRIHKGLTGADRGRLAAAEETAGRILTEAGCRADSIFTTPLRGTHPSATARIGHSVDTDLRTSIDGLYVCDASVFPEALGRPTVLTIIGLARRLAKQLADVSGDGMARPAAEGAGPPVRGTNTSQDIT
jgi:choline dehydrogenase-like flavoprotein